MSEYRASLKQWSEEIAKTFHKSEDVLRENVQKERLDEWQENLREFQKLLSTKEPLQDADIYNRANKLYTQFNSFLGKSSVAKPDGNGGAAALKDVVPIGGHTLPPLPYAYDALEPYIAREIMRLHHDKHHQSYVDGLNRAEKEMQKARATNHYGLLKHWEREAAFHGAGHYLHTLFWNIMSPDGGGEPKGDLERKIRQMFGDFAHFKKHFSEAANQVEGVGWAILVWSPRARRLEILQAEKHQNLSQWDVIPLLVLDVWEHAYYLQYKNERKKYIENWWHVVNWQEVENRFKEAVKLKWQPF
ncbi:superoxide dismutase [Heyndrickxia coagulans]|uniref:superoxide dismutase n=1 Tax=Heyndrickxia coagulans TaxID=1398 RepID=UPI00041F4B9F|nr:superoxide dismutase [Heyndrickxia coagulans]